MAKNGDFMMFTCLHRKLFSLPSMHVVIMKENILCHKTALLCQAPSFQGLCFSQVKCVIRLVYIFLAMFIHHHVGLFRHAVYRWTVSLLHCLLGVISSKYFRPCPRYPDLKEPPHANPTPTKVWVIGFLLLGTYHACTIKRLIG